MKSKDDTLMILFVTMLTIIIWLWAAGSRRDEATITTKLLFTPPEGSTSTVSPSSINIDIMVEGPHAGVDDAKAICQPVLSFPIATSDGNVTLSDMAGAINSLDVIRATGAQVISTSPASINIDIKTMVTVEARVEPVLPNVIVSGDMTVNPSTVTLIIPQEIRNSLPDAITVQAVVSDAALEQLQPSIDYTRDAVVQLPSALANSDVKVSPSRVEVGFKIQSKTQKTTLQQVRVLIAGPAEDYAAFEVTLPRKVIPNVTIEADGAIIKGIDTGDITVFAIVRLATRDMEQRINSKEVTSFLAIDGNGKGHPVDVTVDDPATLTIDVEISEVESRSTT